MRPARTFLPFAAGSVFLAVLLFAIQRPIEGGLFPHLSVRYPVGDPEADNPLSWKEGPKGLASGDLNDDGLSDIVVANLDGSVSVLLADGSGGLRGQILSPARGMLDGGSMRAVAVADLDGDGKMDVVAADIARSGVVVLLGRGDGTLSPTSRIELGPARALAASDLNRDGMTDLLVGCGVPDCDLDRDTGECGGRLIVLLGRGDGTFGAPRDLLEEPCANRCIYDVGLVDIDGDENVDALGLDYYHGELLIFAGHGDGTFVPKTSLSTQGHGSRAFCVVALDERQKDGAPPEGATLDIAVANRKSATLDIFLGLGEFQFSDPHSVASGDAPRDVAAADLDGDQYVDLVVVNRNSHTVSVLRGLGDARFSLAFETPTGTSPRQVVLVDVTGDGVLDAAVNNRISEDISILRGRVGLAGFLVSECHYPTGITPVSVVAEDFNGDGLPDVANVNMRSHDLRVRSNMGGGILGPETVYGVAYGPASLATGDVNGDGQLDLVVASLGAPGDRDVAGSGCLATLLARGNGTFAEPMTTTGGDLRPYWLRLGDLSGDGILDAAVGGLRGELVVFRGRGNGTFTPAAPLRAGEAGTPLSLSLGDLNGDGRLDILTSRGKVLLNDGTFFSPDWSGPVKQYPVERGDWVVETADLDGDGILDLIVALTFVWPDPIAVHFGVGDGTFLDPTIYPTGMGVTAISIADMDGDGRVDIVTGNRCTANVSIMRSLENREFELLENVNTFPVEGLAVTDMTGDARPDLVGVGVGLWIVPQGGECSLADPRHGDPSGLPREEGIYVNEVMSNNETFFSDALGNSPDWLELYNHTDASIELTGWRLREHGRDGVVNDWSFPDGHVIGSHAYLVVYCSETHVPQLNTGFALSRRGEGLALIDSRGEEVDRVNFPRMPRNVSYARFVDAARFLCYNPVPTMGAENVPPANLNPSVDAGIPYVTSTGNHLGVTAETFDDTGLAYASVFYRVADQREFEEMLLFDDGLHGDGAVGDGIFGATLPDYPAGSTVLYYLRVVDLEGQVALTPGEPSDEENLLRLAVPSSRRGIRISEVLADNENGLRDERGQREDWLELENCGGATVRLDGMVLTKDYFDSAGAWLLPPGQVLPPGGRLVVFCDDDTNDGLLHANFRLDRDGDQVVLVQGDDNWSLVDSISFGPLPEDTSFGRPTCGGEPQILVRPTPGQPNSVVDALFVRGDVNGDGEVDISDAVRTLQFLFAGGRVTCEKSADMDDNGFVNITDPIALLSYLFRGGPPLPQPATECGDDPSPDALNCDTHPPCA